MDSAKHVRMLNLSLVLLLGTGMAIYITRLLLQGQSFLPGILIVGLAGVVILSALDRWYWMLIPLGMTLSIDAIQFGPRSIEFREIVIAAVFVFFVVRQILLRQQVRVLTKESFFILCYFGWIAGVWCLNPTGLMLLGSGTIGARFYFKLILAFLSFVVLSNEKMGELGVKWVVRILLGSTIASAVLSIIKFKTQYSFDPEDFYTWQQSLSQPALWLGIWLFARKKIEGVFKIPSWGFAAFLLILVVMFFSGKRALVGSLLLIPVIQVLIDRKGYRRLMIWGVAGVFGLTVLVAGQGELFHLPKIVQRSIANVPGIRNKLDREVEGQTRDVFRKNLREIAREKIKENPLTGMGGYAIDFSEAYSLIVISQSAGQEGVAFTRSWHNTWLGIAADFGIPASVFWAGFYLQALLLAHHLYRKKNMDDHQRLFVEMVYIYMVSVVLNSWTGGHSALLPMDQLWLYGIMIGIKRSEQKTSDCSLVQPEDHVRKVEPGRRFARL